MWEDGSLRGPGTELKHQHKQLSRVMNDGSGHSTVQRLGEQCVCVWEFTVTYTERREIWEESWIWQVRAAPVLRREWVDPLKLSSSVISGLENPRVLINFNETRWRISWKHCRQMKHTWQRRTTGRRERFLIFNLVARSTQKSMIVSFFFFG